MHTKGDDDGAEENSALPRDNTPTPVSAVDPADALVDYMSVNLSASVAVITNFVSTSRYQMAITLTNVGGRDVSEAGWRIYFSSLYALYYYILVGNYTEQFSIIELSCMNYLFLKIIEYIYIGPHCQPQLANHLYN